MTTIAKTSACPVRGFYSPFLSSDGAGSKSNAALRFLTRATPAVMGAFAAGLLTTGSLVTKLVTDRSILTAASLAELALGTAATVGLAYSQHSATQAAAARAKKAAVIDSTPPTEPPPQTPDPINGGTDMVIEEIPSKRPTSSASEDDSAAAAAKIRRTILESQFISRNAA